MCDFEKDFEREPVIEFPAELPEHTPVSPDEPVDLLPEYCEYRDEGCSLAPSCLNCPFPQCVLDLSWGSKKKALTMRKAEIIRLFTFEKKTIDELAARFNISRRTVIRALADHSR
jgi:hypothetical protein